MVEAEPVRIKMVEFPATGGGVISGKVTIYYHLYRLPHLRYSFWLVLSRAPPIQFLLAK